MSDAPTIVLGGDLTLILPKGVQREDRPDTNWRDESRFAYEDDDGMKFVIVAVEMYSLASKTPTNDIARHIRARGIKAKSAPKELSVAAPLRAWEVAVKPDRTAPMPLAYAAFIRSSDSSVQALYFYVDRESLSNIGIWTPFARTIASSASAGKSRVDFEGGERIIAFGTSRLSIKKPAGWYVGRAQSDESTTRYRLRKLGRLGDDAPYCDLEFRSPEGDEAKSPEEGLTWRASRSGSVHSSNTVLSMSPVFVVAVDCRGSSASDVGAAKDAISSIRAVADK